MTLAHLSDTHLGYRRFLKTTESGFNMREADVLRSFQSALEAIAARKPDLIIHAGDLFHQVRPSNATIVKTYSILSKIQEKRAGKPFVIIGGNHDTPRTSDVGNILRLFDEIPGVELVTENRDYIYLDRLQAEVLCVPHQSLRLNPKDDFRPSLKRGVKFKFLTLHGLLLNEQQHPHDIENALTLDQIHPELWDYVALGDFHGYTSYANNIAYAGSTDYTSSDIWSEVAQGQPKKGWVWFDTQIGKPEFIPITEVRPVIDLPTVEATGLDETQLLEKLKNNFSWDPKTQPIVRQLVLGCSPEARARLRSNQLRDLQQASLHYLLDARLSTFTPAPGARPGSSLDDDWRTHLKSANLPSGIAVADLEKLGLELLQEVRTDDPQEA